MHTQKRPLKFKSGWEERKSKRTKKIKLCKGIGAERDGFTDDFARRGLRIFLVSLKKV